MRLEMRADGGVMKRRCDGDELVEACRSQEEGKRRRRQSDRPRETDSERIAVRGASGLAIMRAQQTKLGARRAGRAESKKQFGAKSSSREKMSDKLSARRIEVAAGRRRVKLSSKKIGPMPARSRRNTPSSSGAGPSGVDSNEEFDDGVSASAR